MTFRRFIDILLRNMMLNVWLILMLFVLSLPVNDDLYFLSHNGETNTLFIILLLFVNLIHWMMELLCLFLKITPDVEEM